MRKNPDIRLLAFLNDNINVKSCGKYSVGESSSRVKDMDGDVIIVIGSTVVPRKIKELKERNL